MTPSSGSVVHVSGRLLSVIKIGVLCVSVLAAIPTARNLYFSWANDIPFSEVSHRLAQYDLWMRNLDCKIEYRALTTANNNRVDVGACAETGDIAIKITAPTGHAAYEWVAFSQLQKPTTTAQLVNGLIFGRAMAAEVGKTTGSYSVPHMELAQAGMEVLCQARSGERIVRIVKDGGKCFRELVSPLRGKIESRHEVACSAHCQ